MVDIDNIIAAKPVVDDDLSTHASPPPVVVADVEAELDVADIEAELDVADIEAELDVQAGKFGSSTIL